MLLLIPPHSSLSPGVHAEDQELRRQVKKAIATLSERYQRVVTLRYLTQIPFSEIGRLTGIPQATVKTHL